LLRFKPLRLGEDSMRLHLAVVSASTRRVAHALSLAVVLALTSSIVVAQQQESVETRLKGFDAYMDQMMKDWNAPGIGVGIVMGDKLVFARGYGFRDYGKKLPYTV